jgi:hypothetical protein
MAPVIYLLAILGCGDDQSRCEQVRVEPAAYASVASCRAAMPGALMRNTDLAYPVVVTQCKKSAQVAALTQTTRTAAR